MLPTPWVWKPLVTELLADPRIRDCCQFWFFYYPTGQPVPLSALELRRALDDAVARTQLLAASSNNQEQSRARINP
ncbi:hypothetical protein Thiowin_02153 [Thiorhodovibrio winogradskyi]|uniref:Uncharacterized protein n=1 Tax=Thiorhodovibrio winogradskyi TaxID=77007 RepID=A0ABZ0SA46_9GAMM|nr:hypothetical protein [Thiorhodovibrio winogradskyi]